MFAIFALHLTHAKNCILNAGKKMLQGVSRKALMVAVCLVVCLLPAAQAHILDFDLPALAVTLAGESSHHTTVLPYLSGEEHAVLPGLVCNEDNAAGEEKEKEEEEEKRPGTGEAYHILPAFEQLPAEHEAGVQPPISRPCHLACRRLYIWCAFSEAP